MPTFEQIKTFSWMSQASYLTFIGLPKNLTGPDLAAQLSGSQLGTANHFAGKQAEEFSDSTSGFTFIDQYPNDLVGFSATVFKSNADGSYTVAIRGTEPNGLEFVNDLLIADGLGVALSGAARLQMVAAYRYYKQLATF